MSVLPPHLPYLTAEVAPVPGTLRSSPADFVVDEVPAYPAAGEGDHLFVRFRKVGLDTPRAVRQLAEALEVDPKQAGWAGLKDRHAVTTQWASFFGASPERAKEVSVPGVTVLEAVRHPHKLRVGHVKANRFTLTIRGAANGIEAIHAVIERVRRAGVPNYFGEQRFGRGGANLERARRWLVEGGRPPRGRFDRKLLVSVLQSALFNEVLAARLSDGLFERAVPGDVMRRESSGGLFVAADADEVQPRMSEWEISPTGPMFGTKMRSADGEAREREEAVRSSAGVTDAVLARFGRLGEGTRRPLRVQPDEIAVEARAEDVVLSFALPSGAYATALTREILKAGGQLPE